MNAERRKRIMQIEWMLTKAMSGDPAQWIDKIIVDSLIQELEFLKLKEQEEPDEIPRRKTNKRDKTKTLQT